MDNENNKIKSPQYIVNGLANGRPLLAISIFVLAVSATVGVIYFVGVVIFLEWYFYVALVISWYAFYFCLEWYPVKKDIVTQEDMILTFHYPYDAKGQVELYSISKVIMNTYMHAIMFDNKNKESVFVYTYEEKDEKQWKIYLKEVLSQRGTELEIDSVF